MKTWSVGLGINPGTSACEYGKKLRLHYFRDSQSLRYRRFLSNLKRSYIHVLKYLKFHTLIFRRGLIDALFLITTCDGTCAVLVYCTE